MCQGGLDPKYMMRDVEARVKGVAFAQDKSEVAGEMPAPGLLARLVALFRRKQAEGSVTWQPLSRN
jgi:hypothetical protein